MFLFIFLNEKIEKKLSIKVKCIQEMKYQIMLQVMKSEIEKTGHIN